MTNLLQVTKSGLFSSIYKACTLLRTQSVLNTPVASYVSDEKIYESLQIPKPPKRLVNNYSQFLKERLDGKKLTGEQRREAEKLIAAEWRQMKHEYKIARAEWEMRLTGVQRALIANAKKSKQQTELIEKRQHIADCIELNMPKFPPAALDLFVQNSGNGDKKIDVGNSWRNLSPFEQQKYYDNARELRAQYDEELIEWEAKMMQQGKLNLVRKTTIEADEIPEKPQPNTKKTIE